MIDLFAREIGLDPVVVRRRNFVQPDAFPTRPPPARATTRASTRPRSISRSMRPDYPHCGPSKRAGAPRTSQCLLGIGIASYVESSNPAPRRNTGDRRAPRRARSHPHRLVTARQGHATTFGMIASDITGIPLDRIDFVFGDTATVPRGGGTGGSRSVQVGGSAVKVAADRLVEVARLRASDALEASVDDIVLDRVSGSFHVIGSPARRVTWSELAAAPRSTRVEVDFTPDGATFPFGAHVAVVDVDTETGRVTLRRLVAVDDAGVVVNPLLLEGQIHGGIASGVAQALTEEICYDGDGNLLTGNFADYGIISAAELPTSSSSRWRRRRRATRSGAKGVASPAPSGDAGGAERGHRCGGALGRAAHGSAPDGAARDGSRSEVESIEVHDLVPRRDEVAHELLVVVVTRVDLRERAEL
jgi:carbon-monoxide dehydrogenase large subunit